MINHPEFKIHKRNQENNKSVLVRMHFNLGCWFVSIMAFDYRTEEYQTFHTCQYDYSFEDSLSFYREYLALAEMILS